MRGLGRLLGDLCLGFTHTHTYMWVFMVICSTKGFNDARTEVRYRGAKVKSSTRNSSLPTLLHRSNDGDGAGAWAFQEMCQVYESDRVSQSPSQNTGTIFRLEIIKFVSTPGNNPSIWKSINSLTDFDQEVMNDTMGLEIVIRTAVAYRSQCWKISQIMILITKSSSQLRKMKHVSLSSGGTLYPLQ